MMNFLEPHSKPARAPAATKRLTRIVLACSAMMGIGGILLALSVAAPADGRISTDAKIFNGVQAADIPLGGMTRLQALDALTQAVQERRRDARFTFQNQPVVLNDGHDEPFLVFHFDDAVSEALGVGRTGSVWRDLITRWRLRLRPVTIDLPFTLDDRGLTDELQRQLKDVLVSVQDAQLNIAIPPSKTRAPAQITIVPEQVGLALDAKPALEELRRQATQLSFTAIPLNAIRIQPGVITQDLQPLANNVPAWLARAPFRLQAEQETWTVTSSTLAGWLTVATSTQGLTLTLDPERVRDTLGRFAADLIKDPQDGNFGLDANEKMKNFTAPVEGIDVDADATIVAIQSGWAAGSSTMPLVLVHATPQILGSDAERLGIREILGVGRSNFARSPVNRRKNIAHGAALVNGALIRPDEEFSLLKTLGHVDQTTGWLQELVIKGDKTTPEFGGGLCQIGTTTFRAALASGLPITMRQNHSYRVPYYEPAGTDATIYEPAPDFRFKNDTGHWILVTTEDRGDNLAFTFWGTRDGRIVRETEPRVFNFVQPPDKKIVETLELKPGETKCTEKAHVGADASFEYAVTYPEGKTKQVTFHSHYKPWGAVCLLGVKHLSASGTASGVDETGVNNPN